MFANAIRLDFVQQSFDRRENQQVRDPTVGAAFDIVNDVIGTIRTVLGAHELHLIWPQETFWRVDYLTDEGAPVLKEDGLIRRFGGGPLRFSCTPVTQTVWAEVDRNAPKYLWDSLLLDSKALLPDVGPAITLAATALEVFVASVIEDGPEGDVPGWFWSWVNDRGDWRLDPSVAEQFDVLLRTVTGHSLKESDVLWTAFIELRKARNAFAHEGKPTLGKRRDEVTPSRAAGLVEAAENIIGWVEQFIPHEKRRTRVPPPQWQMVQIVWAGDETSPRQWSLCSTHDRPA